ncbi:MAG: MerR family transcriptional regulator [Nitriliruptoraceae bacterium]
MTSHTIGEVLNQLRDEFEDVTISKIRFLESEGLIYPDRTESGYRKFTPADVDRLRYVLRAQRDRYLPLKVIRSELDRIDAGLPVEDPADAAATPPAQRDGVASPSDQHAPSTGERMVVAPSPLDPAPTDVHLDAAELTEAAGLGDADLESLVDHGLLGTAPYDGEDLQVAKLAAELLGGGLEVRHLRMYRQFAERELALAEQLVAPLLRQRNPDSRRAAGEQADLLVRAGASLHRTLLVQRLRAMLRTR